jgi:hypothetical protein
VFLIHRSLAGNIFHNFGREKVAIELVNEPNGEPSETEELLGFRVKNGMTWYKNTEAWGVPLINHLQKAVEVIEQLIKRIPSDEEIAKAAEDPGFDSLQRHSFKLGAEWMREQLIKEKNNV